MRSGRELEADTSRDVQGNDPQTPVQDREIKITNPDADSGTREALGSKGHEFSQRDRQTLGINNAVRRHRDFGARREPVRTEDLSGATRNCSLVANRPLAIVDAHRGGCGILRRCGSPHTGGRGQVQMFSRSR